MLVSLETQHYQFLHGALDEQIYLGYERVCKDQMLAFRGFQMVWQITRDGYSPEFVELVDRLIDETSAGDSFRMITDWRRIARDRKQN